MNGNYEKQFNLIEYKKISLIKMTCTANDYLTVAIALGGFIISEILPHCPGVEANGILHFLTLLLKKLSESSNRVEEVKI